MFALIFGRPAGFLRLRTPSPLRLAALAAYLPFLAGCAVRPDLTPPAALAQTAAPVSYKPVLSGYVAQRPTEPKPWRERNDSVAPQEKAR
jgi:hypothetical protein